MVATANGFTPLVTHLFPDDDPYVDSDVVFAVKKDLIVPFVRVEDPNQVAAAGIQGKDFFWDVTANIVLAKGDDMGCAAGQYVPGASISMKG